MPNCIQCNPLTDRAAVANMMLGYRGDQQTDDWWRQATMTDMTDSPNGTCKVYAGGTPCFVKRHCGDPEAHQATMYSYTVKTCRYEKNLKFKEKEWKYDKTGLMRRQTLDIGIEARLHPEDSIVDMLNKAELVPSIVDGVPLTGFNHCWNDPDKPQSNLIVSEVVDPANPTCEEVQCCVYDTIAQIYSARNDQDKVIRKPNRFSHFLVIYGVPYDKVMTKCFLPTAACTGAADGGANVLRDGAYDIRPVLEPDYFSGYTTAPPPVLGAPATVGPNPSGHSIIVIGVPRSVGGMGMGYALGCTTLEEFRPWSLTPDSPQWRRGVDCQVLFGGDFEKAYYPHDWTLIAQCNLVAKGG